MKKFLSRIAFFFIPVVLMATIPAYFLYKSKENFKEIDPIIVGSDNYLFGYAYNDMNFPYIKWKNIVSHRKYDVLAIGSSRVLQFRKKMFTKSFYNAGYTIIRIEDCVKLLKSIPKEKYPEYLIIGIDQWMYNEKWNEDAPVAAADKWEKAFSKFPTLEVLKLAWTDVIDAKYSYSFSETHDSIKRFGLNAIINGKGFRPDGSINYGNQLDKLLDKDPSYTDYQYRDTYFRVKTGTKRFQYGQQLYPEAVEETEKLLIFCKRNHIKVVAFLPPFADGVYNKMLASGRHNYLKKIFLALKPMFGKYGFELYDFSTVSSCNSNDNETIDGFHGGEFTYLKMMMKILESQSVLNHVASLKQLQLDAQHPINRYWVYQ